MTKQNYFNDYIYLLDQPYTFKQIKKFFIHKALRKFFNDRNINRLEKNQLFGIIPKLRLEDNSYISLTHLRRVNKKSYRDLRSEFMCALDQKSNTYQAHRATEIIFTYHIFTPDYVAKEINVETNDRVHTLPDSSNNYLNFDIFKFPLNT